MRSIIWYMRKHAEQSVIPFAGFPNPCEGSGRELGGACELVGSLGSFLYLQLSYELEFLK